MALDPSIPLQAGQGTAAPQNPLAMAGQAVGIANAVAQNKLLGVQTQAADQGLNAVRQKAIGTIAMSVLHLPDDQIVPALHGALDRAVAAGVLPKEQVAKYEEGIAQSRDAQHLRQMIAQVGLTTMDPNGQFAQIYGAPQDMSNGQAIQPGIRSSPFMGGGFRPVGGGIDQFPSRADLAARVPGPAGPRGEPTQVPLGTVTPPNLAGPAASPLGDGRLPPALRNPANLPAPTTGAVTTGLGPAQTAAQGTTGTQSAGHFQNIAEQGVQARGQDAILANMETEAAQFTQGVGQERIKNFQAAALRFAGPLAQAFGVDEKAVAANQSFDKLAAQIADAQGAKSDARLQVTQAANPSSSLTPAGINLILKQLRGNTDYINARAKLAASWPDKADREGFEAQVGKNLDPRAFQFQRLDDTQRREFLKGIKSDADKAVFQRSYMWARDNGLLTNAGQ